MEQNFHETFKKVSYKKKRFWWILKIVLWGIVLAFFYIRIIFFLLWIMLTENVEKQFQYMNERIFHLFTARRMLILY